MATTLADMQNIILRFLNKTSSYPGFYDTAKLNDAINEAFDFVAAHMFTAGEGWLTTISYITTTTNMATTPLPTGLAMVRELRYKVGDTYQPMTNDQQIDAASYVGSGIQQQDGVRYRLVGKDIVFDPPLSDVGVDFLQVEGVYYPASLSAGADVVDAQFDNTMRNFVKYKACSIMAGGLEKDVRTWGDEEAQWYEKMQEIVTRRNLKSTPLREFY